MTLENIKVVIPARYSSTRLPGKPLLQIKQKPIFWHVVQRCLEAGFKISDIHVATDDIRIVNEATHLNIPIIMTSTEHESGSDRINEVAEKEGWSEETVVLNVQGDEPLIPVTLIKELSAFTLSNPEFLITTAVKQVNSYNDYINPNIVKAILGEKGRALYFTRSPAPLCRDNHNNLSLAYKHVGIYAYTVASLRRFCSYPEAPLEKYEKLEQLRALSHGMSVGAFIFDGNIEHGVDTISDYERIKSLIENENYDTSN
ncbi:3-deoxy-manno-octulosonate cytidylyltransferase [Pseudoalteromonas sp. MMG010]|uniref:3-deoxy-manno-octulosonate cytidylyltransferase n=1 Tax=Pseudoalteromonas sp. MMG010 TaxID=2822685 RepID=UPI001B3A2954|nr:3-deoxy-manno-octulosonate cytidylyltransferase [Pseudoalteromonas sp. MMG010]MBQ4834233.1 3-deoxy-manno-octulosonate cytidylyltransferase [Pseudoalteromonas sp. MMG010]